jgi:hypothetical protein
LAGFVRFWAISPKVRSQNMPSFQVHGLVRNTV